MELVREEIFTGDAYAPVLNIPHCGTVLIKLERTEF
jgi:hypothetical protein